MSFKENLKAKIKADKLFRKLASTMKEPPGKWWVDRDLIQELLDMTDLEHTKFRDLHLYTRPLEGEILEVLVFDNELPIYHTTLADVALRKSPLWQEMFSIRNIKKIMNHHDVLVSRGKASIERIHAIALALLDLTYTRDDLAVLVGDARRGLEHKSIEQIQESFDLFFNLLNFEPVPLDILDQDLMIFARPKPNGGALLTFEDLIFFDEQNLQLGLKKGVFSPQRGSDLAWVMQYVRGEQKADLQGPDVFAFLSKSSLEKADAQNNEHQEVNTGSVQGADT